MSLRNATLIALAGVAIHLCYQIIATIRLFAGVYSLWHIPGFLLDVGLLVFFWSLYSKQKSQAK